MTETFQNELGIAFGFALVLGSLAFWLASVLGEPDDGVEPVPPPTAPREPAAA